MNKLSTANFKNAVLKKHIHFVECVPSKEISGRLNIVGFGPDKRAFILASSQKETDILHIKNKITVVNKLRELKVNNAFFKLDT